MCTPLSTLKPNPRCNILHIAKYQNKEWFLENDVHEEKKETMDDMNVSIIFELKDAPHSNSYYLTLI